MKFTKLPLKDAFLIEIEPFTDERGWFGRTYCKKEFQLHGIDTDFVQFNHSFNLERGTVRGMHFQKKPFSECKLIRCIQGSVLDVLVDIRPDSVTFLQHYQVELNDKNNLSIFVPTGFAHGFQVLENKSSLIYHHTEYYNSIADSGVRFDDPLINIKWELPVINLSIKDKSYPLINQLNFSL
jgi:dTDP-4-dehydrorhamnose 3,5-epimerase